MKCVADPDAVEGIQQVAPAGILDCSTLVAIDAAGRVLLLDPIGYRAVGDDWVRSTSKIKASNHLISWKIRKMLSLRIWRR